MKHNQKEVLDYWNDHAVESMYDKNLLTAEIRLLLKHIPEGAKILDAGCGEGEGTLAYSHVSGTLVHAADFSDTRLQKAIARLAERTNVVCKKVDFLGEYELDNDYDIVVSQRFLINLMEWSLQQQVLLNLVGMLKPGGRLLLLEGSQQGAASLNEFRAALGLDPIPVKWHNLFLDDHVLVNFLHEHGHKLLEEDGLGTYFLLTRGVRPLLDQGLNWDCEFNHLAAAERTGELLALGPRFSRLKLWVFQK